MKTNKKRTYSELSTMATFEERYEYLKVPSKVGEDTFGFDRYLNQKLYKSAEWKKVRDTVIIRDNACDLGIKGRELGGTIYVHHMNPIGIEDIEKSSSQLLNPEFLVCVSFDTHNAIHFGNKELLNKNKVIERREGDTCPWKRK